MKFFDASVKLPELDTPVLAFWNNYYEVLHRGISPLSHKEVWYDKEEWDGGSSLDETFPVEKWAYITPPEEDDKWISVTEKLPEEEVDVLVCFEDGIRDTDRIRSGKWSFYGNVICWRTLPDKPKDLEKLVLLKKYKDLRDDLEALKEMISKEDI